LRFVISQPEAALYIQVPMFETTVAAQMTAKARYRNGDHGEAASWRADGSIPIWRERFCASSVRVTDLSFPPSGMSGADLLCKV
jgi:hypothetical protein